MTYQETIKNDTILIIESNAKLRLDLKKILIHDYEIKESASGEEALHMILKENPVIILCNMILQGMSGEELCRQIRESMALSHIPIVLISSEIEKNRKLLGLDAGADDYISKPLDANELKARLRNLIKLRHQLKQKYSESSLGDVKIQKSNINRNDLTYVIEDYINSNLKKSSITVKEICDFLGTSQSNLYHKIKSLTSFSPSEFIRMIKVKHAAHLLEKGYTVSEAAYNSGFNSLNYFSSSFRKYMGELPSKYLGKIIRVEPKAKEHRF